MAYTYHKPELLPQPHKVRRCQVGDAENPAEAELAAVRVVVRGVFGDRDCGTAHDQFFRVLLLQQVHILPQIQGMAGAPDRSMLSNL